MCLDITHTEWLETYLCSKLSPPKNTYIQFYTISECLPTVCYTFSFSDVFHPHCPTDGVFTVKSPRPCYSAIHSQQKNTGFFHGIFFSDHGCVLLTKYHKKRMVEGQHSSNKNVGPTFFILPPQKKSRGCLVKFSSLL